MLGSEARMRLSEVISLPPSAKGTLKSTRIKTRLPVRSRSRIDKVAIVLLFCTVVRRLLNAQNGVIFFRDPAWPPVAAQEHMLGESGGDAAAIGGVDQFVFEADQPGVDL